MVTARAFLRSPGQCFAFSPDPRLLLGCYQHDTQSCGDGYINFDCLTAKGAVAAAFVSHAPSHHAILLPTGVLWGTEAPTGKFGDC